MTHRRRPPAWPLFGLAGLVPLASATEDPPPAERLRALERATATLAGELEALRAAAAAPGPLLGDVLDGLRLHGGVSQGFAWSDAPHDYLTLGTSRGSFAFSDMTLGLTKPLSERLQLGIQLYNRNFGELGEHRFQLDYAQFSYRWRDWLTIRAGRSKTVFGLHNDTQDQDSLHPWVFPPFGALDPTIRDLNLNHDGLDLTGRVDLAACGLPDAGQLGYTVFAGTALNVAGEGLEHILESRGLTLDDLDIETLAGVDLRYLGGDLLEGLTVGASFVQVEYAVEASGLVTWPVLPPVVPPSLVTPVDVRFASFEPFWFATVFGRYELGDLEVMAEVKFDDHQVETVTTFPGLPRIVQQDRHHGRGYYALASWRWTDLGWPWLQTTASWSDFVYDRAAGYTDGARYLRDLALTARIDVTPNWYLKVEVHDQHGWGWDSFTLSAQEGHKSEHWFLFAMKTGVVF